MFRLCFIIASILCHLLAAPQARACLGLFLEDTLFFTEIPNPRPGGDVILKVTLSKVDDGSAVATVTEILQSSGPRIHVGDKLPLRYRFTSCGPNHHEGDQGLIIAKAVTDSQGNRVLYPYMRRIGDSRLTPPSIAGKQSPPCHYASET
jgi:hypothetical protein